MEIYVVRHGETDWNVIKVLQGSRDVPLNEKGLCQAKIISENLEGIEFSRVFSSPLARAKKTAEIICEKRNVGIITDCRLAERNYGEFEGVKRSLFDYNSFWSHEKNEKYEKAENVRDFLKRVSDFIDEAKEKYRDERILVVAHAGIMKAFRFILSGLPEDGEMGPYIPENCEAEIYRIN